MKLRAAVAHDVEELFALRCSVIENHQSREELAGIGITTASVTEMVESDDFVTTLAESDGQLVGFTMAQISEGHVLACFVRPGFEGQGVGRTVMQAAEQGLARAGVREAWLSTGPGSALRAVGFYAHLGWFEDGCLDDGQIIFRKRLCRSA